MLVQMASGRKCWKLSLETIGKEFGFIDKQHNRVSVRRLREPLLKPTVSGYFWMPLWRLCYNFSEFDTKRYMFCFKNIVQMDAGREKLENAFQGGV